MRSFTSRQGSDENNGKNDATGSKPCDWLDVGVGRRLVAANYLRDTNGDELRAGATSMRSSTQSRALHCHNRRNDRDNIFWSGISRNLEAIRITLANRCCRHYDPRAIYFGLGINEQRDLLSGDSCSSHCHV
jgi:hypothetical protein